MASKIAQLVLQSTLFFVLVAHLTFGQPQNGMFHDRIYDERYDLKQPKVFMPDIQKMNPGRHQYGLHPIQTAGDIFSSYQGIISRPKLYT